MIHRVYYADGTSVDLNGSPSPGNPPPRGVELIVPLDRWHPVSRSDYYVWLEKEQRYEGVDLFGLYDYLLDSGLVLFGRMMETEEFNNILRRAKVEFDTRS